jgi:hypothetical protein
MHARPASSAWWKSRASGALVMTASWREPQSEEAGLTQPGLLYVPNKFFEVKRVVHRRPSNSVVEYDQKRL